MGTPPLGAGWWGHLDLGGSLWEWNLDRIAGEKLPADYEDPCTDCVYLADTEQRLVRGGQFENAADKMHPTARDRGEPSGRSTAQEYAAQDRCRGRGSAPGLKACRSPAR